MENDDLNNFMRLEMGYGFQIDPSQEMLDKRKKLEELLIKTTNVEEVLSLILQTDCFQDNSDTLITSATNAILNCAFGTINVLKMVQEVYRDDSYNPGPCRANISESSSEFIYQCLDCQINSNSLICSGCFENSCHLDHRYILDDQGVEV